MLPKRPAFPALILITLLCLANLSPGQENRLEYFNGGVITADLEFGSSLLTGIGAFESSSGRGITTLYPSPASIYWNPAGLAFLKNGGFLFEALPGFKYEPDVQETVDEEVDTQLEDMEIGGAVIYPKMSLSGGLRSSTVSSVALAYPWRKYAFGLAYHSLLNLNLNALGSGIEAQISTIEENPETIPTTIYTAMDLGLKLDLKAEQVSIAAARRLTDRLGLGLSLTRTSIFLNITGRFSPEGILSGPIVETAFNDPSAGYPNDFYQEMNGSFSGSKWGLKFGLAFNKSEKFCLDFAANITPSFDLKGDMEIVKYVFPALNLQAEEGEQTFDINMLNLAEATRTKEMVYLPSDEMTINIPSSFAVGMGYRALSLTVTGYSGELGYEYKLGEGADSTITTYARGLKPKFGALLGLKIGFMRLSAGAVLADEIVKGYKDKDGAPLTPTTGIPIPRFNLGFGFGLLKNWRLETLLVGLPETAMRFCVLYNFE